MTDYAIQRANMVESQVRTADVTDRRILRAMSHVPRELFATGNTKALSYMDEHLPVGQGRERRFLLAPRTFAKLVQLLEIDEGDAVLDVCSATGYSTAVLARLAKRVVAVEPDADLAASARATLAPLTEGNVVVKSRPCTEGAPDEGPYDAILINGCVAGVPDSLLDQLKDGGRLAAVVASDSVGKAMLWRRRGPIFDSRPEFDAAAPALAGFAKEAGFVF